MIIDQHTVWHADGSRCMSLDCTRHHVLQPKSVTARTDAHIARHIGPRRVGGIYRCAYWGQTYEVTAINGVWLTVVWEDGRETTHCTAWDTRDRVIAEPREHTCAVA